MSMFYKRSLLVDDIIKKLIHHEDTKGHEEIKLRVPSCLRGDIF